MKGKDVLIFGGFNWLGYELTKLFIEKNLFSNIIIVDNLRDYLSIDNALKRQFDGYAHLYNENIFMYTINIKDKTELEKIYKVHNIGSVINNIKFNCSTKESERNDLLHGYANIIKLNDLYSTKKYIYLTRSYTHEKMLFSRNRIDNFLEENFIFNESAFLINENKGTLINIPDYIFGNKCYFSNNLFYKLTNIIKIKSPLYVPQSTTFCLCDNLLLMLIFESLFADIDDRYVNEAINQNISGPYRYIDIFNYFDLSSNNIRTIIDKNDKKTHSGIVPQDISNDSLFGKYLQSLNSLLS